MAPRTNCASRRRFRLHESRLFALSGSASAVVHRLLCKPKDRRHDALSQKLLAGAGWDPISAGYTTIPLTTAPQFVANDYVIQKDLNKQLVLYWYQGRGRVIASEYSGKFWMVADAISRNRTDGALVRLITPIDDDETKARKRLISFAQSVFPDLDAVIPK